MLKLLKNCTFGIFGCSCKVSFFVISLITAYCYSKTICFILLSIFVLHNAVSLWYMKGKKIKVIIK